MLVNNKTTSFSEFVYQKKDSIVLGLFIALIIGGSIAAGIGYHHLATTKSSVIHGQINCITYTGSNFNPGPQLPDVNLATSWGVSTILKGTLSAHMKALGLLITGGLCGGVGIAGVVKRIFLKIEQDKLSQTKPSNTSAVLKNTIAITTFLAGLALILYGISYFIIHRHAAYHHGIPTTIQGYETFVQVLGQAGTFATAQGVRVAKICSLFGSALLGIGLFSLIPYRPRHSIFKSTEEIHPL